MSLSELISPVLGRFVLAWYFLNEIFAYADNWHAELAEMSTRGVHSPALLLAAGMVVMALGVVSLALGLHTKGGALLLFAFVLVTTYTTHDFWHVHEASARATEFDQFARNCAVAGGLLAFVGLGPGGFALDNKQPAAKKKK